MKNIIIVIQVLLYTVLFYYIRLMRSQIDSRKKEMIDTFYILEVVSYLLLIITYISFSMKFFVSDTDIKYCPLRTLNMMFLILMLVFMLQTRSAIQRIPFVPPVCEKNLDPVLFVDMKFRVFEYLSYSLIIFNMLSYFMILTSVYMSRT